ncbi:MAG: ABC transporter permease subunit [Anaeromicrobium sp.]|jgi:putative spermidine/putrescine transport system permease protein|uniref:ABC transporter permease n=1 Tax=Anaeromicrobium sp. TaxID=1929132 RepID=UPI0025DBDDA4|nr:ABC transporter permease subunit [Anaeromicrobium sp.]MCT4595885.1 ABC transporter permease subunit [Anaeromicrobium sp.]
MKRDKFIYEFFIKIIIISLIIPIGTLVLWSFTERWPWPHMKPTSFNMRSIGYVFRSNDFFHVLYNSLAISFIVTILTNLISIPAGKAIGVYDFKGKELIKALIMVPIIVPIVAVSMGIHITFIKVGLANNMVGVIIVQLVVTLPYSIKILTSAFENIKDKFEIQGQVLGANRFQQFRYITLPLIMPSLISSSSLVFVISFSQYFLTILIGGGRVITYSMVMFPFIQSGDRSLGSAYGIVFIIITLVVLFLLDIVTKTYYRMEKYTCPKSK